MRRILLATLFVLLGIAFSPSVAHAGFGIATGFGFSAPHPLTPHVGRVYYKPGNGGKSPYANATSGPTELDQFLNEERHIKHDIKKVKCDDAHLGYIERHGFTTPRPLKGFHGCKKYELDKAYWAKRHHNVVAENKKLPPDIPTMIEITIHNILLPW